MSVRCIADLLDRLLTCSSDEKPDLCTIAITCTKVRFHHLPAWFLCGSKTQAPFQEDAVGLDASRMAGPVSSTNYFFFLAFFLVTFLAFFAFLAILLSKRFDNGSHKPGIGKCDI
ncbi:hypothetical protein CQ14_09525 [Bradyrhizobium lablabi]|uniref:Uncharacterized protein n=1 Tax=Bradyrhizobium lablabi TaxID=722472 RepID=A0A0R3N504_9BRAD|nr:hypothetical protein [Bradyrhizobium lablabi]KRR25247.1 hypothetical protein CQ14_09525 [Bradyrhizobium lablabi]